MKKPLIRAGTIIFLLLAALLIYSIYDPYIAWFHRVQRAHVTVDGKSEVGWLHRGNHGQTFVLTHGPSGKSESYMIWLREGKDGLVWKCGDWTAPRFPVFAIGDVSPPCLNIAFDDGTAPRSPKSDPPKRDLKVGEDFLEFTLNDGRRLKATW